MGPALLDDLKLGFMDDLYNLDWAEAASRAAAQGGHDVFVVSGALFGGEILADQPIAVARRQVLDLNTGSKTARAQQGRVQVLGTIRRANDEDIRRGLYPVKKRQQRIQRAAKIYSRRAIGHLVTGAEGVEFIHENDAGATAFCRLKKLPHQGRALAGVFASHELAGGNRKKRQPGFAGQRLGQQGLACTRRSMEQDAQRWNHVQAAIGLRVLEIGQDLAEPLLGFFMTGHIPEAQFRTRLQIGISGNGPRRTLLEPGHGQYFAGIVINSLRSQPVATIIELLGQSFQTREPCLGAGSIRDE